MKEEKKGQLLTSKKLKEISKKDTGKPSLKAIIISEGIDVLVALLLLFILFVFLRPLFE